MKWPTIVLSSAAVVILSANACQGPEPAAPPDPAPIPDPEPFPLADDWAGIMENVMGPRFEESIQDQLAAENPDFAVIAADARIAADHMALGYGVHAREDLPEFAVYARETETWLHELARRADANEAELGAWVEAGIERHCDRCHDATDR